MRDWLQHGIIMLTEWKVTHTTVGTIRSKAISNRMSTVTRVVKRSSDLRTSNFKFVLIFVFQPSDIRIQASLIRRRRFCLESWALRCTVWQFLCSLPAVNSSDAHHMLAYPSPPLHAYHRGVQLLSTVCAAPLVRVVYWCKLSKWQILMAQTQSRHQSTAIERDMAWRPGWLHCW